METVDLTGLLNLGAVGIIASLGIVFMRFAYMRECQQNDENRKEIARLNTIIQQQQVEYLPVLTSSNRALEESAGVLKVVQDKLLERGAR